MDNNATLALKLELQKSATLIAAAMLSGNENMSDRANMVPVVRKQIARAAVEIAMEIHAAIEER